MFEIDQRKTDNPHSPRRFLNAPRNVPHRLPRLISIRLKSELVCLFIFPMHVSAPHYAAPLEEKRGGKVFWWHFTVIYERDVAGGLRRLGEKNSLTLDNNGAILRATSFD